MYVQRAATAKVQARCQNRSLWICHINGLSAGFCADRDMLSWILRIVNKNQLKNIPIPLSFTTVRKDFLDEPERKAMEPHL